MKTKFGIGIASLMLAANAGTASAADLAAQPYANALPPAIASIYSWSGFYIGLNGGGGSSHKCWDLVNYAPVIGGPVVAVNPNLSEGCHDATGGTIGGQYGYRWQAASWVFGVEGQGNWADFSGSNVNRLVGVPIPGLPGGFGAGLTDRSRIDSFGMITGQIGYAWNSLLGYVKGGAAVVHDKYDTSFAGVVVDSASENRWGGVIGVGLEFGFAPGWSVAFEYDHMFLGHRDIVASTPAGLFSATDRINQDVDLGTIRLNYNFGGPVVARY
jgi:outer membrane immunogenic protein